MGNERFESGWITPPAKFVFLPTDLSLADFDRVSAGVLNLTDNVFTDGGTVPAGAKRIVARFTIASGNAAIPNPNFGFGWDDTVAASHLELLEIIDLAPEGRELLFAETPATPVDVTLATIGSLYDKGEITFFLAQQLAETFETDWPAPTPGLE